MNKNNESKDYIVNFRVSRETYEKIKDKAQENRETVSNLVRKVVEDTVEIVGDISKDMWGRSKDTGTMVSYTKVVLALNVECSNCEKVVKAGTTATVGYNEKGKMFYFCATCKK